MASRSHDECQPGHAVHPPNAHLPTPADQDPTGADQRSRSPLFKVDQIRVPVLIAQGANDPRVPQAESEQIVAALKANGTPYEYVLFPDEGHGFAKPENRLRFYAIAERFLATHLGGRYQADEGDV